LTEKTSQIVQTSQTIDPKNLTGVLGFATLPHQESFFYISAGDYKMIKIDTTNYDNSIDLKTLVGNEVAISSSFKDATNLTVLLDKVTPKNPTTSNINSASDIEKAGGGNYYLGDKKLIVVMCKYADVAAEPQTKAQFEERLNGTTLDTTNTYWKAITDDQMTITGSATGWITLPKPKSSYYGTDNYLVSQNDCITAADSIVNYQNYDFIQMVFNSDMDSFAAGLGYLGFVPLQLDGAVKNFGVTWLGDNGWRDSDIVQHEIGHNMGWDHSVGNGYEYGSKWDVMSGGGGYESSVSDYLGTDTSAYYKYWSQILPPEQAAYISGYSQSESIKLEKLNTFDHTDQKIRLAQVYTGGYSYTVETRKKEGYDKYIPENGVIVQKVLPSYWPKVEVVDTEGDNNVNDTGSVLVPGETYLFPGGQKILKVISDYGTGYDIQIKDSFSVEITSPDNTARLTTGSNYQVVAEAEEFGGAISKVEFYSDYNLTNLIGTDFTAPYTLDMTNLAKGDYTVRAKAYTVGGLSKASYEKSIVVADNINYTTTIDGATLSYTQTYTNLHTVLTYPIT